MSSADAAVASRRSSAPDIRLVAVDMDGTLLDGDGRVPPGLDGLLARLHERGILFVPASGRQYATLRREFGAAGDDMVFIAENGAYVVHRDVELFSATLDGDVVRDVVHRVRALSGSVDAGAVVCGKRSAYIERSDDAFVAKARRYYAQLEIVDDVCAIEDDVLKVAVFAFADSEAEVRPHFDDVAETHQVVVSGQHWMDVLNRGVDKGAALTRVQRSYGVTRAQTVAFGDYLNDLQLLDAAAWSFAMANAHPDVRARARFAAPANTEHGVLTVLDELLDGEAELTRRSWGPRA